MSELVDNYRHIQQRIAAAAQRAGRDPAEITLVAVSKSQPLHKVQTLFEQTGHRHYGENRMPEGRNKVAIVRRTFDPEGQLIWHFIGNIQRSKVPAIVADFDPLHAIDRLSIANRLSQRAVAQNHTLTVFLECNVSGESSKAGFAADNWANDAGQWHTLTTTVEQILALPGLHVNGLMTMAPWLAAPEDTRPVFARLRKLRDRLAQQFPQSNWAHLSMGMTNDFEVAIEEGATIVRIGRAIFGERLPQ